MCHIIVIISANRLEDLNTKPAARAEHKTHLERALTMQHNRQLTATEPSSPSILQDQWPSKWHPSWRYISRGAPSLCWSGLDVHQYYSSTSQPGILAGASWSAGQPWEHQGRGGRSDPGFLQWDSSGASRWGLRATAYTFTDVITEWDLRLCQYQSVAYQSTNLISLSRACECA
jgi:hypothetical protein